MMELEELIACAKQGDEQAYAKIVRSYHSMVFAIALAITSERTSAEDIAQDAFVVAWTHLGRLRKAAAFPGWLRKITRNLALAHGRSEQYRRRLQQQLQQNSADRAAGQEGQMDQLVREERRAEILAALRQLSPGTREAVLLYYLEERRVAEAARVLGISENAFKVRLHLGRKKLREHFAREGEAALRDMMRPAVTENQVVRVLSGLAVGPALEPLGSAAAKTGWPLVWHELTHQGSVLEHAATGGIVMGGKKAVVGGSICMLLLAGAVIGVFKYQQTPEQTVAQPSQEVRAQAFFDQQRGEQDALTAREETSVPSDDTSPAPAPRPASALEAPAAVKEAPEMDSVAEVEDKGKIEDPSAYASVSGFVIDSTGQAIPGAIVRATVSPLNSGTAPESAYFETMLAAQQFGRTFSASTDRMGAYTIRNIAYEGRVRVAATAEGYWQSKDAAARQITVEEGAEIDNVNLTLLPGLTLHGRIVSPEREPVADAVVRVVGYQSRAGHATGTLDLTTTDGEGEFELGFVRQGEATLVVSSASHGTSTFEHVPVGEEQVVELEMTAPGVVYGQIKWVNGGPVESTEVRLTGSPYRGDGGSDVPGAVYRTWTDTSGNYRIEKVDPAQEYRAHVNSATGEPLNAPELLPRVAAGEELRWDCTVEAAITVYGQVLGTPSGQPLRDLKVAALKDGLPVEGADAPVDATGAYELSLLSGSGHYLIYPRLWRIEPYVTGYTHGVETDLGAGEEKEIDLRFPDPFTLSVRVVDSAGTPQPGVTTGIREGDHTWIPAGETDINGVFTWGGLMPGIESQIVVMQHGEQVGATDPVTGEPGAVYPEQIVTLFGEGGLEGYAVDSAGAPLANGLLILTIIGPGGAPLEREAPTDGAGHFLLDAGVPAASVQLEFSGFTEGTGGINRYSAPGMQVQPDPAMISDLGQISFTLVETDFQVE